MFGWAQLHSEHCRHKTFRAPFIINGERKRKSLFELIQDTVAAHPGQVVSAYKDNVAFIQGPSARLWAVREKKESYFLTYRSFRTLISLKAETHNFPTTVEPFYGAATGTGGEIRDRMAGGQGSLPLAGTAVYMTPYTRIEPLQLWEKRVPARTWAYQTPSDILIKASNGASDYANKFGQPLICGSILTFEHQEEDQICAYDKVIMLAGGVGLGRASFAQKKRPRPGDLLVLLGGDNYRIGMGGSTISSATTGKHSSSTEQKAVQRANPEMQKRIADTLRTLFTQPRSLIKSIHDHGAGGHLNCFVELLENCGGEIYLEALPIGDHSLSARELLSNESQERMGLLVSPKNLSVIEKIAEREQAPMYVVGRYVREKDMTALNRSTKERALHLPIRDLMQAPSLSEIRDRSVPTSYAPLQLTEDIPTYFKQVLSLEAVASKEWLTSKVDRCVGGRVAMQPTCGPYQLPLNNLGAVSIDFDSYKGIATALGHAPLVSLIDPMQGSMFALTKALTNLVWAPLTYGLRGVSLSANWMWPSQAGERVRLYQAVEALRNYSIALGVNIPTGKDSLSMQQQYKHKVVAAPGTLIVSAVSEAEDVRRIVSPLLVKESSTKILYLPLAKSYALGGSSLAQVCSAIGQEAPEISEANDVQCVFEAVQQLLRREECLSGHDIGAGGLIVSLLEWCLSQENTSLDIDLSEIEAPDTHHLLFSEAPALLLQVPASSAYDKHLASCTYYEIGHLTHHAQLSIQYKQDRYTFDLEEYAEAWYRRSEAMEVLQSSQSTAQRRAKQLRKQPLRFTFPRNFSGKQPLQRKSTRKPLAAILREKGVNSEIEMADALRAGGFRIKDIHMSDLLSGAETLENVDFLVFVGGFTHADALGAAKGWAASFLHHLPAHRALQNFYQRENVLSLGVCNGAQLMCRLSLLGGARIAHPKLLENLSGRFECSFVSIRVENSPSILFRSLEGTQLGVWAAHKEGRFVYSSQDRLPVVARYAYTQYPAQPNGSADNLAALCSPEGRHVAIMPHIERALRPVQWPYYPLERKKSAYSPWVLPFVAAKDWLLAHRS